MERRGNAVIAGNFIFPRLSCGAIADLDYRMAATTVPTPRLSTLLNQRNGMPTKLHLHQPQPRRLRIPEIGTNCSKAAVDCKKLTRLLRKMPWHLVYDARVSRSITIISAAQTRLDPTILKRKLGRTTSKQRNKRNDAPTNK
jgi:hypothetical protein